MMLRYTILNSGHHHNNKLFHGGYDGRNVVEDDIDALTGADKSWCNSSQTRLTDNINISFADGVSASIDDWRVANNETTQSHRSPLRFTEAEYMAALKKAKQDGTGIIDVSYAALRAMRPEYAFLKERIGTNYPATMRNSAAGLTETAGYVTGLRAEYKAATAEGPTG